METATAITTTTATTSTSATSSGSAAQSTAVVTTTTIVGATTAAGGAAAAVSTSIANSPAQIGATTCLAASSGVSSANNNTYASGAGGGVGGGGALLSIIGGTAASSASSSSNVAAASTASTAAGSSCSLVSASASVLVPLNAASISTTNTATAAISSSNPCPTQTSYQAQQSFDDFNNTSMASGVSEGQRSLSGAPSASSSPILSPPGKIFGRNANGTMVATSRPSNEAEIQLYRVLQRASLLSYYDTLLEMGGDDVQQLYEAGEEEFLEIMALVGMATKPLHVRRLQKVLHEWANNPAWFQGPMLSTPTANLCETPTKSNIVFNAEYSANIFAPRIKNLQKFSPTAMYNPLPLIQTAAQTQATPTTATAALGAGSGAGVGIGGGATAATAHLLTQAIGSPATISVPVIQPQTAATQAATLPLPSAAAAAVLALAAHPGNANNAAATGSSGSSGGGSGSTTHQVTSSSPQLTPVLTELQVARITHGAEKIANELPQRTPRAQTSKKRTSRELEAVIAMSEHDPRRMDEIRKYSAIYGRFDCKRRPEKPLTLHEVCVNEAAAQLCRLVPALLTRRDELFPLARQIVKDAGFGHSVSIARYGGLLPQVASSAAAAAAAAAAATTMTSSVVIMGGGGGGHATSTASLQAATSASTAATAAQRTSVVVDCESSDSTVSYKRQRLSPTTDVKPTQMDLNRDFNEDSRYNLFAMYQKFAKPPFDLSDIAKFSLGRADYDDNDNDSRFSFSNSSNSPTSMPHNGNGESGADISEHLKYALVANSQQQQQQQRSLENEPQSSTCVGDGLNSPVRGSGNRPYERHVERTLYMADSNATFAVAAAAAQAAAAAAAAARSNRLMETSTSSMDSSPPATPFGGVQVISAAAAGHIIAVANPALALSPALTNAETNLTLGMKREAETPDD